MERSLAKKPFFFSGLREVSLRGRPPLLLRLLPLERRRPPPREEFEREELRVVDDVCVILTSLLRALPGGMRGWMPGLQWSPNGYRCR